MLELDAPEKVRKEEAIDIKKLSNIFKKKNWFFFKKTNYKTI